MKMCSPKIRRFVHLIVDDLKSGAAGYYSLRNIDVQPLFAAGAAASSRTKMRATRPPRQAASFEFAKKENHMEFFLLGSRIVGVNKNRHTVMYDTSTNAFRAGPDLRHGKFIQPAWAAVRGRLYLADVVPLGHGEPCFESLRFDDGALQDWVWDLLPSPPFFDGTPCGIQSIIRSYAAGDGDTIWLSTLKGTYTFHAGTATWRKEGDWTLPFDGRAQYVPDYGLYFGFTTKRPSRLCSAELVAGARAPQPPAHRDVWCDVDGYTGTVDDEWPDVDLDAYGAGDGWRLARSYLTCLGGGRFCVTRFYDTTHDQEEDFGGSCNVAVITAVEARLDDPSTGGLRMVKGASRCYKFSDHTSYGWAL
jgi:hypothetical protein